MVRKIIVLEQGKVAAQGTPEQFMRQQQAQQGGSGTGGSGGTPAGSGSGGGGAPRPVAVWPAA
jgi:hypothetical protein